MYIDFVYNIFSSDPSVIPQKTLDIYIVFIYVNVIDIYDNITEVNKARQHCSKIYLILDLVYTNNNSTLVKVTIIKKLVRFSPKFL